MTVGRILVDDKDKGSSFALATPDSGITRIALTANHVVGNHEASSLQFVTRSGRKIPVERVERDHSLDIAVLHLGEDVIGGLAVSQAQEGIGWQVETQPLSNDPKLTGIVTATQRQFVKAQGQPAIYVLQLQVDQNLDEYKGYSGSPVMLKLPSGGVIGILVEQLLSRLSGAIGQPRPATNVLYAIPIQDVLNCFGLAAVQTMDMREEPISAHPKSFIPHPPSPLFQSRPGEFEQLEHLLFEPGGEKRPPRVGLIGMGGVGKTQLAVELAYRYLDQYRYPGGIFWMPATGRNFFDWQHQLAALAADTDYLPSDDDPSSPENERRRARHLCRYLADHQDALLILDNVEDPGLVTTVLPALAGEKVTCSLVYTSRTHLAPEGITTFTVEKLPEEGALQLLLKQRRQQVLAQIDTGQMDSEVQAARNVCKLVGYLPLALVLLRGLLKRDEYLTLTRLQEVLQQRGTLQLVPTLFSTFELSWEKVQDEKAQRLFKLACYFPGDFGIYCWLINKRGDFGIYCWLINKRVTTVAERIRISLCSSQE